MLNILKQACSEIEPDISIVKMAGIMGRLRSWYKNLFDPEYKQLINQLRNNSDNIKNNIQSLYRHLEKIDESIKNGDVDTYNYSLGTIKEISKQLVSELDKISLESEAIENKKGPDLGNYQRIIITERNKQLQKVRIVNALNKGGISEDVVKEITDNPNNFNALLSSIENSLLQGKILESGLAKAEEGVDRNGELWVSIEGNVATIGISDFAVKALTDLVFIELPKVGRQLKAGEPFGVVESVKAASDMYSPVSGEVIEANAKLADDLGKLSDDPFGAGWLIKVQVADGATPAGLMNRTEYEQHWSTRAH